MKETYTVIGKTYKGFEDLLKDELQTLGITEIETGNRAVYFECNKESLYKINYLSRLAISFLVKLAEFPANTKDELYNGAKSINWADLFSYRKSIAVDSTVFSEVFTHSKFPGLVVKDAIVDTFREKNGHRPDVDITDPDIKINLHISDNIATVSLDSGGDPLFKRGYKVAMHKASLNEITAAAIIKLSGWDGKMPLLDMMCGSATIPIEAAMHSLQIPAGLNRQRYCFKNWSDFDSQIWEDLRENTLPLQHRTKIHAFELEEENVAMAEKNLTKANLSSRVKLSQGDFFNIYPRFKEGIIIMNPPYGNRIKTEIDLNKFYENMGSHLKHKFNGYTAWIISEKGEHLKHIGLKPSKKYSIMNGPIECQLLKFELFEGTISEHKNNKE